VLATLARARHPAGHERHQRIGLVVQVVDQLADPLLGHAGVLVVAENLLQPGGGLEYPPHRLPSAGSASSPV